MAQVRQENVSISLQQPRQQWIIQTLLIGYGSERTSAVTSAGVVGAKDMKCTTDRTAHEGWLVCTSSDSAYFGNLVVDVMVNVCRIDIRRWWFG